MSNAHQKPVREAGWITVTGKWETRMQVGRAFVKAEEVSRNTLTALARREGYHHNPGGDER